MKLVVLSLFCLALLGAIEAQLTVEIDWTRARIFHAWIGSGGPKPIDISIVNIDGGTEFSETIGQGASSQWVYLKTYDNYAFQSNGYDIPYERMDARIATYVLYGSDINNPTIGVWQDSTEAPPRGKARIRFSSAVGEDQLVTVGSNSQQLTAGSNIKAYVDFEVDPGTVTLAIQDGYSRQVQVEADVSYRAIHVVQGSENMILFAPTADFSVTGRWNIVNLLPSDAVVNRGGDVGEATQTLVLTHGATGYEEYIPGNCQLQIMFLSGQVQYSYEADLFMNGFEEMTMVIGAIGSAGISLNIDRIDTGTLASNPRVMFKSDVPGYTLITNNGVTLFNQSLGWSTYAEFTPDLYTFSLSVLSFNVTATLEAHSTYLVVFNADVAVVVVQAVTGAPYNVRHINAATTCQQASSVILSDTTLIDSVAYGNASEYTATTIWAGYFKYYVKGNDGKVIGPAAFRSEPGKSYSLITIGKCNTEEGPFARVFYWNDDNTQPAAGKSRVKAVHGAYDTSPSNPILQIDGDVSLEQMTFGYFSPLYKEISGGMNHVLNVSFDNNRVFDKTFYFGDQSVATVVTAGSWADDTFGIFVFADLGTVYLIDQPNPSSPNSPVSNNGPSSNTTPTGKTSTASHLSIATLLVSSVALFVFL